MAATFGLYYPNHTSPTSSWEPSVPPQVTTSIEDDAGVLSDLMADGATQYDDVVSATTDFLQWQFKFLTDTDRSNFRTFRDAVRAVSTPTFEQLNPLTGSYETVRFAPGGWDVPWTVDYETGQRLSAKILLRKVA